MSDKYFNIHEFKRAIDLIDIDPFLSITLLERYLEKYPKDYSAYAYYCSNLIILGKIEEAEKIYNYLEKIYKEDDVIKKYDRTRKIEENMIFSKIKLLSYQKKYEELYELCVKNANFIINSGMNGAFFYSKKKTGRLNLENREKNSYLFRQIIKYEESEFLEHIKKHLYFDDENDNDKSKAIFEPNFPIEKVIEEIKKYIPSNKKLLLGFYDNIYFFKYDNCGRADDRIVDYFRVVCIDGTSDIITMCPVVGSKNLPYVDLNYLVKEEVPKIKRMSQIDKFNQRFNKK